MFGLFLCFLSKFPHNHLIFSANLLYYKQNQIQSEESIVTPNYERFLQAIRGIQGPPVLFEPFVPVYLAEQLIWRRGKHLWETVSTYLDTLFSLRERTYADVVIADMRTFGDELAPEMGQRMAEVATAEIRFVALCDSPVQLACARSSAGICGAGLYGWERWVHTYNKEENLSAGTYFPLIAMDGDCEAAVKAGFDGWFCPANGEDMWQKYYRDADEKIAILGGLGVDWLKNGQPVEIHNRCEEIFRMTGGEGYLIGSGGAVSETDYLSLISLLGVYRRWR